MTFFNTVCALLALFLVYLTASTLHTWSRLRQVPGPRAAGFSYLWVLKATASGRLAGIYDDLVQTHGHLVRVGPELVLTDDPEVLRRMSAARSPYGKDAAYKATIRHPDHDSMFSVVDVARHDQIKSKLAGAYSGRETLGMEPVIDTIVDQLLHHLRSKTTCTNNSGNPSAIDLAHSINYFTMDVITRLAFGQEIGFLASDSDVHGLIAAIKYAMKTYTVPLAIPWLRDIFTSRLFLALFGPKPTDKSGVGLLIKTAQRNIDKRFEPEAPDQQDLLGGVVRSGIQPGECVSEMLVAMIAGSDTTASAIRSTMLHLIANPRVYKAMKETVRQAVRSGTVSSPIKLEEAKRLPYVQAVIYEGLRNRPPAPVAFPKRVPPGGDFIHGKFIPGGTTVVGLLLPAMRSAQHWGDDAEMFRPERFLDIDDKTRAARERLVELGFGYGRFRCAGQPVAFVELNKVFFELFRHFDFELANPSKPWNEEFYTVWQDEDFRVLVSQADVMS